MTSLISRVNQYLLERHPTVWNTKLVWMLCIAFVLHLVFFILGYVVLSNPASLQERGISNIFFKNGTLYISVIFTVLLLVIWLVYLFKNNAFKHFYPVSRAQLFFQYIFYLLIVFSCSSFYLSYSYGTKAQICSTYSNYQINKEIAISNDAAAFLTENTKAYTIDQRRYPAPFNELFCETREKFVNESKPFVSFLDEKYQFFTLKTKIAPLTTAYNDPLYAGFIFNRIKDSVKVYYYLDQVVNPLDSTGRTFPSYYNYSSTFYKSRNDTLKEVLQENDYGINGSYDSYDNYNNNPDFSLRNQLQNKRTNELLQRNDPAEIKQLLSDFLKISSKYRIKHNLDIEAWFTMIYHPKNFEVRSFIRNEKKKDYAYAVSVTDKSSEFEKFYKEHVTDYYFENNRLQNVFENIEDIKASNPFLESIHFFMWLSFFCSVIIFMFRITGLKPLFFGIVTVGVLILLVALLGAVLYYLNPTNDDFIGYFISYVTLIIGCIILAIPIVLAKRFRKIIVAICVNISMAGFVAFLLLILATIAMHQRDACNNRNLNFKNTYNCDTVFDLLGLNWSFVLFFAGILFMYFYVTTIKNWKSLPET